MPLAPNSLLQPTAKANAQTASANALTAAGEPSKNNGSSFAQVYEKESRTVPAKATDAAPKSAPGKQDDAPGKQEVASKDAAGAPAVADSGKTLPADKSDNKSASPDTDDSRATDELLVDSLPADPLIDPLLAQVPVAVPEPAPEALPDAVDAEPLLAAVAAPVAATVDPDFDPAADPLDALPAVRLAMEQGGHLSAASQGSHKPAPLEAEPTPSQNLANGVASLIDQKGEAGTTEQGGDKAFKGLIDDGLKDLKSASSDTRVDDFANRLAALTQAATPKTANALPVSQPLAMNQSGWTEEVVNRVMYLSSANLKSADIQLEPAELGRLDIRVNMAADQPTQVNFASAHVGVREALEGQMFRLRDMFAQQGMGQVDVNVSDQSRGWQQNQEQAGQGGRGGDRLDTAEDDAIAGVAEAAGPSVLLGTSAVDYYA